MSLSKDDHDDDVEDAFMLSNNFSILMAAAIACVDSSYETRDPSIKQQRVHWADCSKSYESRSEYSRHMRMAPESFSKLLGFVRERLTVDQNQSL